MRQDFRGHGDAIRKLADFRTQALALGTTGNLGAEDAARLDAQAAAAISCIEPSAPSPHIRPGIGFTLLVGRVRGD